MITVMKEKPGPVTVSWQPGEAGRYFNDFEIERYLERLLKAEVELVAGIGLDGIFLYDNKLHIYKIMRESETVSGAAPRLKWIAVPKVLEAFEVATILTRVTDGDKPLSIAEAVRDCRSRRIR